MSLKEDLQTVDGVGEATAEELITIIEDSDVSGPNPQEINRVVAMLERGSVNAAKDRLNSLLE